MNDDSLFTNVEYEVFTLPEDTETAELHSLIVNFIQKKVDKQHTSNHNCGSLFNAMQERAQRGQRRERPIAQSVEQSWQYI